MHSLHSVKNAFRMHPLLKPRTKNQDSPRTPEQILEFPNQNQEPRTTISPGLLNKSWNFRTKTKNQEPRFPQDSWTNLGISEPKPRTKIPQRLLSKSWFLALGFKSKIPKELGKERILKAFLQLRCHLFRSVCLTSFLAFCFQPPTHPLHPLFLSWHSLLTTSTSRELWSCKTGWLWWPWASRMNQASRVQWRGHLHRRCWTRLRQEPWWHIPTRQPLQKKDVTTMMGTIQRQLRLQPGGSGGWNEEAQRRLETLLANPKRSAQQLALEDRKPEDKMPEDKKSSSDSWSYIHHRGLEGHGGRSQSSSALGAVVRHCPTWSAQGLTPAPIAAQNIRQTSTRARSHQKAGVEPSGQQAPQGPSYHSPYWRSQVLQGQDAKRSPWHCASLQETSQSQRKMDVAKAVLCQTGLAQGSLHWPPYQDQRWHTDHWSRVAFPQGAHHFEPERDSRFTTAACQDQKCSVRVLAQEQWSLARLRFSLLLAYGQNGSIVRQDDSAGDVQL